MWYRVYPARDMFASTEEFHDAPMYLVQAENRRTALSKAGTICDAELTIGAVYINLEGLLAHAQEYTPYKCSDLCIIYHMADGVVVPMWQNIS